MVTTIQLPEPWPFLIWKWCWWSISTEGRQDYACSLPHFLSWLYIEDSYHYYSIEFTSHYLKWKYSTLWNKTLAFCGYPNVACMPLKHGFPSCSVSLVLVCLCVWRSLSILKLSPKKAWPWCWTSTSFCFVCWRLFHYVAHAGPQLTIWPMMVFNSR